MSAFCASESETTPLQASGRLWNTPTTMDHGGRTEPPGWASALAVHRSIAETSLHRDRGARPLRPPGQTFRCHQTSGQVTRTSWAVVDRRWKAPVGRVVQKESCGAPKKKKVQMMFKDHHDLGIQGHIWGFCVFAVLSLSVLLTVFLMRTNN